MEAAGQSIYAVFYCAAEGTKWEAGLMGTRVRLASMGTVEWSGTIAVVGHQGTRQQREAQKASLLGTAVEAEV